MRAESVAQRGEEGPERPRSGIFQRGFREGAAPRPIVRTAQRRLDISGLPEGASTALVAWLSTRPEVAEAGVHAKTGDVHVTLARGGGAMLLAEVRDQLYLLRREGRREGLSIEVARSSAGRARLAVSGASEGALVGLASWLACQPGVSQATASTVSATVLVLFDPAVTDTERLAQAARDADPHALFDGGPALAPVPTAPEQDLPALPAEPARGLSALAQAARPYLGVAFNTAVFAATVAEALPAPFLLPAVAATAIPSLRRFVQAAREGRATVDSLDTAAIASALVTGQVGTAAFMTWLIGLGDLLLDRTQERARKALTSLVQLDSADAFRVEGGRVARVPTGELAVGDRIVVAAGQRIPADAEVDQGLATVDEKALTGESVPRPRHPGDRLLAATVVVDGEVVARVTRTGMDTTAARIVRILEQANAQPMSLQKTVEKSADRLVWPTIATAVVSAALSGQVQRLTSVLINDFGTGIRIAVPTNALTAVTLASRAGVLIKGGSYLELLARADMIVFDKTGTLTAGEPAVVDVAALGALSEHELLALAAAAEARKEHPIAAAVRRRAAESAVAVEEIAPGDARFVIGRGVAARVAGRDVLVGSGRFLGENGVPAGAAEGVLARHRAAGVSTLLVAVDGRFEGALGYADAPRPESAAVVAALKAGGRRRTVLLSGDARAPVEAVARAVGVDEAHGELLPEDKVAFVKEAQRLGRVVAMVGDGINDAPALALADVGISLHGSTDVALEAADVILLEGGLRRLQIAFEVGEQAMRRVRQGVGIVVVPNAVAIVLGALGIINPAIATVANNGSTLLAAMVGVAPLLRASP